ncbi:uracil-DNA glycosylase family protein [Jannaschia marina]|uniref:uracil-DNA glycosylase family protein n=1 Tax=Jannaschia marina TaxID=2741674 RepID=UPI0015CC31BD|nr:uracil-DNA glycosylase family protein [Jannaschia marina]
MTLPEEIAACRLCADRFAATATAHAPRPVVWFGPGARILVAGQAPGMRVHISGRPFDDPSGVRLRDWMGVDEATFWDKTHIAIAPMAFCFPGYDAKGSDLAPPPICARTWRAQALDHIGPVDVTLLVGGHAQTWALGPGRVTDRVRNWREHAPRVFCLPHPSWRNTAWLKRNPWFAEETLPTLRTAIREALT